MVPFWALSVSMSSPFELAKLLSTLCPVHSYYCEFLNCNFTIKFNIKQAID